jgi:hypothetical protein
LDALLTEHLQVKESIPPGGLGMEDVIPRILFSKEQKRFGAFNVHRN